LSSITVNANLLWTIENALNTHDVAIPLSPPGHTPARTLRILIITPSTLAPSAKLEQTMTRIMHFAALTGDKDNAIFYFPHTTSPTDASSSLQTFDNLQALLFSRCVYIPLVYLASTASLLDCLKAFMVAAGDVTPKEPKSPDIANDILPYSSLGPLDPQAMKALKGTCTTLGELATMASSDDDGFTKRLIANGMTEEDAECVVDFWRNEYLAEE
jgi:hypothetical protein